MTEKYPPCIVDIQGLYVASRHESWVPGQTVYVPHTSSDYYEVSLEEKVPAPKRNLSSFEFWIFSNPVLHETEPGELLPWELASPSQIEYIEKLIRTKKFERAEGVIRNNDHSVEVEIEKISSLSKASAGELISFLKKCKNKTPDYPVFRKVKINSGNEESWVLAGVPSDLAAGDEVVAMRRSGDLRHVILKKEYSISGKTFWRFRNSRRPKVNAIAREYSTLCKYVINYYLDEDE